MNNKKTLFILFIILSSCNQGPSISFQDIEISEKSLPACQDAVCPSIHVSFQEAEGDFATTINTAVQDAILETLSIGEEGSNAAKNLGEGIEDFIAIYQEHKAEYFDMTAEYEVGIDIYETFRNKNFLCFQKDYYKFTGGAHGYGGTSFLLFDLQTGKQVKFSDLIDNSPEFSEFAEAAFRKAYDIPEKDNINSSGFLFEKDEYHLPEAIGFEEKDLILVYNPYEIAPYSEGQIELRIPLEDLENYLQIH